METFNQSITMNHQSRLKLSYGQGLSKGCDRAKIATKTLIRSATSPQQLTQNVLPTFSFQSASVEIIRWKTQNFCLHIFSELERLSSSIPHLNHFTLPKIFRVVCGVQCLSIITSVSCPDFHPRSLSKVTMFAPTYQNTDNLHNICWIG